MEEEVEVEWHKDQHPNMSKPFDELDQLLALRHRGDHTQLNMESVIPKCRNGEGI